MDCGLVRSMALHRQRCWLECNDPSRLSSGPSARCCARLVPISCCTTCAVQFSSGSTRSALLLSQRLTGNLRPSLVTPLPLVGAASDFFCWGVSFPSAILVEPPKSYSAGVHLAYSRLDECCCCYTYVVYVRTIRSREQACFYCGIVFSRCRCFDRYCRSLA